MPARSPYVDHTRRFFGRWSPIYDAFAAPIGFAYAAAARRAAPTPGLALLDLCTGTGEIAWRLRRRGAHVTAIDLTASMLDRARHKRRTAGVRFAQADARQLPFPDLAFDAVTLSFALHDMPRQVRQLVLGEAARVARERLVVLDYELAAGKLIRRFLLAAVSSFETPWFPGFVRDGGAAAALGAAGLTVREIARPAPGLFAVRVVAPRAGPR